MKSKGWIQALFRSLDARDAEGFISFLTEDASFTFGNVPTVTGHTAIRGCITAYFSGVRAIAHTLQDGWISGNSVICAGRVTYTRHNGSKLTVPFCNVLTIRDDAVAQYRFYADISPLRDASP